MPRLYSLCLEEAIRRHRCLERSLDLENRPLRLETDIRAIDPPPPSPALLHLATPSLSADSPRPRIPGRVIWKTLRYQVHFRRIPMDTRSPKVGTRLTRFCALAKFIVAI
jgi:hypothetical protein